MPSGARDDVDYLACVRRVVSEHRFDRGHVLRKGHVRDIHQSRDLMLLARP